ncbi:flippase-like domain-containing protein [Patescibacteria group bacterium]|nr:flippase-like domain-containing protein [Patescibacteria group bacterium]
MKFLKKLFQYWYILIGLLIFFYILFYKINLAEVSKILIQANLFYIGLAVFFVLLMILIQPIRWNYLKKAQNIDYPLKDSFFIYNTGFFLSTITPGRIGDLIKVLYLKKDGYSIGKSLVSIILDRLADIVFLLIIGYLSIFFFFKDIRKDLFLFTFLGLIILALFIIFQRNGSFKKLINKILGFIIPSKYKKSWHLNYQEFINDFKGYKLKNYLVISLITVVVWFFYYSSMFFLAKSIGLEVPLIFFILSVTLATLATLMPVSILGLGTRDATLLLLFSSLDINPEITISFSTLYLLMLLMSNFIGFLSWLKKPLKFK